MTSLTRVTNCSCVDSAHDVEFEELGGGGEVNVIVVEARDDEAAFEIDDAGVWATEFQSGAVRADDEKLAVADGDCFGGGIFFVDGPDDAVVKDDVRCLWLLSGGD